MDQPKNLFLIGRADLEILEISQLLTANGFAEGRNSTGNHLACVPKFTDIQNMLNNEHAIAVIEFLQIIHSAPGSNTNINSSMLNRTMYPPRIPGCGLNKTS
ncbi:MAG: hypothetical protein GZ094_06770 [Mariniphaga sp.]|nr:hypothetical protein [Mariniphaga sp.]